MKLLLMVVLVLAAAGCAAMVARRLLQLRARMRELAIWQRWHMSATQALTVAGRAPPEEQEALVSSIHRGTQLFEKWFYAVATPNEIAAYERRRQELHLVVE